MGTKKRITLSKLNKREKQHFKDTIDGRISLAAFKRNREFHAATKAEIGQISGQCSRCGRALSDPTSVKAGLGPECIKTTQNEETMNRQAAAGQHYDIVEELLRRIDGGQNGDRHSRKRGLPFLTTRPWAGLKKWSRSTPHDPSPF